MQAWAVRRPHADLGAIRLRLSLSVREDCQAYMPACVYVMTVQNSNCQFGLWYVQERQQSQHLVRCPCGDGGVAWCSVTTLFGTAAHVRKCEGRVCTPVVPR